MCAGSIDKYFRQEKFRQRQVDKNILVNCLKINYQRRFKNIKFAGYLSNELPDEVIMFGVIIVDQVNVRIRIQHVIGSHQEEAANRVKSGLQHFVEEFLVNPTAIDTSLFESCTVDELNANTFPQVRL